MVCLQVESGTMISVILSRLQNNEIADARLSPKEKLPSDEGSFKYNCLGDEGQATVMAAYKGG